ncbi:VOC family protein [Nocardioides sp.]|jgi:catechol 2,3-dioxygenase-like lactoylglutathione lyase family enzyme|uniref:VOC family protein n=1 Tax=Nocardioides sp. TaxID=35761 RepID=UPI00262703F4|nr:VOC family protein [Nocardioides sp.]
MDQAVERLGYVVMGVPDVAGSADFYRDVGHLTVHDSSAGTAFLGGGYDHHWLRLEQQDQRRGLLRVGFELGSDDALGDVTDRLDARGIAYEEFGDLDGDAIDRGVRFTDPDGLEIDVYTQMLSRGTKPGQNLVRMQEMLHAVWFSTDPVAAHDFYSGVLGFRASDWIKRNAVFMRSGNNYHHSMGIFRGSPERAATMDHFCILVESIDDVMRARNIATSRGATLQKDVLRHAASGSISVYIADPAAGISFEFCTEHDIVDADHRARILEATPISRDVWMQGTSREEIKRLTNAAMGVTSSDEGLARIANSIA